MTNNTIKERLVEVESLLKEGLPKRSEAMSALRAIIDEIPREPKRGDIVCVEDEEYGDILVLEVTKDQKGFLGVDLADNTCTGRLPATDIVEFLREAVL